MTTNLTPQKIVEGLNKYIVGQTEAKKSVAISIRDRWRRMMLPKNIRDEIVPKNMLMIGPTGVGKTEIARRLAKLANAPFIKVEATKFTEVGYVGRDVEQIIRDLLDTAINMLKSEKRELFRESAKIFAQKEIVATMVGRDASPDTKDKFMRKFDDEDFLEKEIEIELSTRTSPGSSPFFDFGAGNNGMVGMINITDAIGKAFGVSKEKKLKKVKIRDAMEEITNEELEREINNEQLIKEAIKLTENNGIVFIDEIDKICGGRSTSSSRGEVSREGVQRDLLPIVEGTVVQTKHGPVETDFILFIASGAFHVSKPSDLLPELQGRFPIRVELSPLSREDLVMILTDPEMNLIEQARHMLSVEGVNIVFQNEAIEEIANIAYVVNSEVENIGARRLNTIIGKVLEDVSFNAADMNGQVVTITKQYVMDAVSSLSQRVDLSRFIL